MSFLVRSGLFRSKRFWALTDISFDLHSGETLGVIGRNGAGKSTLLRLIAGIISADRGTITNRDCTVSLLALQAGFVPYLSGRENALLGGLLLGVKKKEILRRMDQIKAFSELEEFFDQPIHTYSTGMRARLGFSIAFQVDPDVLLIDEVLGVGDAEFNKKSSTAMRERIQSDKTIVLVSHNIATHRSLCDRIIWIEHGKKVSEGRPEDILPEYQRHAR